MSSLESVPLPSTRPRQKSRVSPQTQTQPRKSHLLRKRLDALQAHSPKELPHFAAQHCAISAWRIDPDTMTPWVFVEFSSLPDQRTQLQLEAALQEASASTTFLCWVIASDNRERLVFHLGGEHERWVQEGAKRRPIPHLRELQRALLVEAPYPIRLARAAALLTRKDVTHRFYRDIQRSVHTIAQGWTASAEMSSAHRHELALILVARLMFLHFVQSKNWLPHPNYLAEVAHVQTDSSYRDYWRPLFFDALNLAPDERTSGVIPDTVPYLNGGLFAESDLERQYTDLDLPNEVLRQLIVDVFARYAFVDDEHEGHPHAIAPQLLGEIFERLMQPEERQVTGAFYTPHELALSVWTQALGSFLHARLGDTLAATIEQRGRLTRADAEKAFDLLWNIRVLDPAVGTGAFLLAALLHLEETTRYILEVLPEKQYTRRALRERWVTHGLHGIDIQRNAVLLAELRLWLSVTAVAPNTLNAATPLPNLEHRLRVGNALLTPTWKRFDGKHSDGKHRDGKHRDGKHSDGVRLKGTHSDGPCLNGKHSDAHGVSTQSSTSGNAQTRRTPVQRSDLQKHTRALADALAAFPQKRGAPRQKSLDRIRRLEATIARESIETQLQALKHAREAQLPLLPDDTARAKPCAEENALAAALKEDGAWQETGAFDPKLHFADVMQDGGFDIVIGNPPWGQISTLERTTQKSLRARYTVLQGRGGRQSSPDMSIAFFEAYLPLLAPDGRLAFIFPAKTLRAGWGAAWRQWAHQRATVETLDEMSTHSNHGFHASVYPCICVVRQRQATDEQRRHPALTATHQSSAKLRTNWRTLSTDFRPRYGVKTGCNRAFLVAHNSPLSNAVPVVRGKNLRPFEYTSTQKIVYTHDAVTGASLSTLPDDTRAHLDAHKDALTQRSDLRQTMPWWTLFRVRSEGLGWRVAWRDVAQTLEAVVLPPVADGGPINLNSTYCVATNNEADAKALCAWLNTDVVSEHLTASAQRARNGYYRFDARVVALAPIPNALFTENSRLRTHALALFEQPGPPPADQLTRWNARARRLATEDNVAEGSVPEDNVSQQHNAPQQPAPEQHVSE